MFSFLAVIMLCLTTLPHSLLSFMLTIHLLLNATLFLLKHNMLFFNSMYTVCSDVLLALFQLVRVHQYPILLQQIASWLTAKTNRALGLWRCYSWCCLFILSWPINCFPYLWLRQRAHTAPVGPSTASWYLTSQCTYWSTEIPTGLSVYAK